MLLNTVKPLQKFIIPDILNNSSLHNCSTGYIYQVNGVDDRYYIPIEVIITRKGKIGKPRASHGQLYALPLLLPELVGTSAYESMTFIVTKDVICDVFNMDAFEFISWMAAKYILMEKNSSYCRNIVDKEFKKPFKLLIDAMFSAETVPTHVILKYETVNARKILLDRMFLLEHFSKQEMLMVHKKRDQLDQSLSAYSNAAKQHVVFEPIKKLVKTLYAQDKNAVFNNLHAETDNVLQKYKNCSYWI